MSNRHWNKREGELIEKFNAWFRKAVICKEDDCETCKPLRDKWKLFLDSLKGGLEKNG